LDKKVSTINKQKDREFFNHILHDENSDNYKYSENSQDNLNDDNKNDNDRLLENVVS